MLLNDKIKKAFDNDLLLLVHHHADVDAHLSYLTWATAGKTILVMMIIYAAFYGISGFYNSIQPNQLGIGTRGVDGTIVRTHSVGDITRK